MNILSALARFLLLLQANREEAAAAVTTDAERGPNKVSAMLRITVHDDRGTITLRLEGRLAGPWVRVLEESWQSVVARHSNLILRLDLTGLSSFDTAGLTCLAELHRQGAEMVAGGLMRAVVAEISQAPAADLRDGNCGFTAPKDREAK